MGLRVSSSVAVGLAVPIAIAFGCTDGGLREDGVLCEETVARLEECCGSLKGKPVSCTFHEGSCSTNYPDISVRQAECIREKSCEEIVRDGLCGGGDGGAGPSDVAFRVCGQ